MASPTCTVNAASTVGGVDVSASSSVTIQLADLAGVNTWSITCTGTDEVAASPTLTVDNTTKTATFTAGAAGSAYIFKSTINGGLRNGVVDASYSTTFAVYVLTAGGQRVVARGEKLEGDATAGWVAQVNGAIRALNAFDPLAPGPIGTTTPDVVETTRLDVTASGGTASLRAYNANPNGALAGASGDLCMNHAGGTAHVCFAGSTWGTLAVLGDFASPPAIGSGTPAAVTATAVAADDVQSITATFTSEVTLSDIAANRYLYTDGSSIIRGTASIALADLANSGGAVGDVAIYDGSNWVRSAQSALIYRSVDANHVHAYRCSETSGTTITDTGSGARDLTLSGSEGTAFVRGSLRGARFARGVTLYGDATSRGAYSAATASITGNPITIEATTVCGYTTGGFQCLMCLDAGTTNDYFLIGIDVGLRWYAVIKIAGVERSTAPTQIPIRLGVRQHVMAVYDRTVTPTLSLYVDGQLVATDNNQTAVAPTWTRVALGNIGSSQLYAYKGTIYDARVSNTARGAAYAITAAEAAWTL